MELLVLGLAASALVVTALHKFVQWRRGFGTSSSPLLGGGIGIGGLLVGDVAVEDKILEARSEAQDRLPDGVELEIDWERYLGQVHGLAGLSGGGGLLTMAVRREEQLGEGYHVMIRARSPRIPPFLQLPAAAWAPLLKELGSQGREVVERAVNGGETRVQDGAVSLLVELPATAGGRVSHSEGDSVREDLRDEAEQVVAVAFALGALADIAPRWLAESARTFQGRAEGLRRLQTLVEHYPSHAVCLEACAHALDEGGAGEQILAAMHLGHPQRLRELYFDVEADEVPGALFAQVVERLYAGAAEDEAEKVLRQALRHSEAVVLGPVLRWLRVLRRPVAAVELAGISARTREDEARKIAVQELAVCGDPEADEVLLDMLESALRETEPRFDHCENLVMSLNRVGTTEAVPLLRALGEGEAEALEVLKVSPRKLPEGLRQEARAAVYAIQSRIDPQQRGGLAIAAPEAGGALAIAAEGGGLALDGEEDKT